MRKLLYKIKKQLYKLKPPCAKCPYKLGLIHTVVNPCSNCKLNGYQAFEEFKKQVLKQFGQ